MTENGIAKEVVGAALRIHRALGPGLLESVYETVLAHALEKAGLRVARQQMIPVEFEGTHFEIGFVRILLSMTR